MERQTQYYNMPQDHSVAYGFVGGQPNQRQESYYGQNNSYKGDIEGSQINDMNQHIQQTNIQRMANGMYSDGAEESIEIPPNQFASQQNPTQRISDRNNSVNYGFIGGPPDNYYGNENFKENVDSSQINEMSQHLQQTSTQRVAAAMYPEAIDGGMDIPSTQFTGHQTAVQRLSEPSQMLRHAIVNIINYQDDADLASRALPELIKLLNDDDNIVVNQAAKVIHQLSLKEASRHALSNSSPLVEALIQTLENSNDLDTTKLASKALGCISQNNQGLLAIFKTGGIRALIHALSSPNDAVVFNAMTTLHNLLLHQEGAKINVRLNGGIQKMVNLLQREIPKFLAIVADSLHILAFGNQEGKLIILASGGPAEFVRILHSFHYEKLLFTTARVLKVLSVCPNNKDAIIQAGGMQALALCLNHQSRRLIQECLWTLRNLSDGATKEFNMEPLLQRLVQLLDGVDINIVTCAAGALSNLTCNNQSNKNYVCNIGGVQTLVRTLRNYGDNEEIVEPTLRTLKHITGRHWEAGMAQDAINLQLNQGQNNEPWFDTDL